jgi:hypothetical protein
MSTPNIKNKLTISSALDAALSGNSGLPAEAIRDAYEAILPVFEKYRDLKRSHMGRDRTGAMVDMGVRAALADAYGRSK